jgi:hypothetical protein
MKRAISALSLALLAGAATAQDAEVFGDASSFEAACAHVLFSIDFDGSPGTVVDGDSFHPGVTFSSPEAPDPSQVVWSSDAITDAGSTTAANFVGPMAGEFASPVRGFSLTFLSASEQQTVELYDEDGDLIDSVVAPNASGFFGVLSHTPIKSFVIVNGLFDNGNPDRFFIDDFAACAPCDLGDLSAFVEALDPEADMTHPSVAVNENRIDTLLNCLGAVENSLDACDIEDAVDLLLSLRQKADGGSNDWLLGDAAGEWVDLVDCMIGAILAEDCDGDGFSNGEELDGGSDPGDPASQP